MLITLAVIGALAILAWFIRAVGLKRFIVEFENKPDRPQTQLKGDENPTKQLKD